MLTHQLHSKLLVELEQRSAGADLGDPCHWIDGGRDPGANYCAECAEVARDVELEAADHDDIYIGGGYRTDHDSWPFCETCERRLDGDLTAEGAEQELEHFQQYESSDLTPTEWAEVRAMVDALPPPHPLAVQAYQLGRKLIAPVLTEPQGIAC